MPRTILLFMSIFNLKIHILKKSLASQLISILRYPVRARPPVQYRIHVLSALLFSQGLCVVALVHRSRRGAHFPTTAPVAASVAWVNIYRAGDGLDGRITEVMEGLRVQEGLLLSQALFKELPFVPELNHRLCVGVEGGDGGCHATGERAPGHTVKHTYIKKIMRFICSYFLHSALSNRMDGWMTFVECGILYLKTNKDAC